MKMLLFALLLPIVMMAQEENESYSMWQTIYLTPNTTTLKALGTAMASHNKTFHKDGPHRASVYNVANGPNTGKMVWLMGPLTYADLDTRPGEGGHDEDWRDKVMPNITKVEQGEYWRADDKLSNFKDDPAPSKLIYVRYHEINDGQGYRVKDHFTKISETIKSMPDGGRDWGIFYNEFWQGNKIGRHIATCSYMDSWAEMDNDWKFKAAFEAVHGENSWTPFLEDAKAIFSDQWDEIWVYNAKLSSDR